MTEAMRTVYMPVPCQCFNFITCSEPQGNPWYWRGWDCPSSTMCLFKSTLVTSGIALEGVSKVGNDSFQTLIIWMTGIATLLTVLNKVAIREFAVEAFMEWALPRGRTNSSKYIHVISMNRRLISCSSLAFTLAHLPPLADYFSPIPSFKRLHSTSLTV